VVSFAEAALGFLSASGINLRNRMNISYAAAALFFAVCMFGSAVLNFKLFYAGAFLAFTALIYFCIFFTQDEKALKVKAIILLALPGATFSILALSTKLLVASSSAAAFEGGPLFYVFILYSFLVVLFALTNLFREHSASHGLHKIQIRYVLSGFALIGGSLILSSVLPASGDFRFIGASSVLIFLSSSLILYPLLVRRLISIESLVQKGFIYILLAAVIFAIFSIPILIPHEIFRTYSSLMFIGLAAALIAIGYLPLLKVLQMAVDKIFFRERYDYQMTLQETSRAITSVIRLEELGRLIVSTFTQAIKVSEISFLLFDGARRRYRSVTMGLAGDLEKYKKIEIDEKSAISSWLKKKNDILVEDEIEYEIGRLPEGKEKEGLKRLLEEVTRLGIQLWVPIISKKELMGIIALGEKQSGEIYSIEDLNLLTTLANQTALALDNVRLYEEVVNMKNYSEEILQSMMNGVLTTDMAGNIVTSNEMAEKITGWTAREITSKNLKDVWGERGLLTEAVFETIKGKTYQSFEGSLLGKTNIAVPVNLSTVPLVDSRGKKIGVLVSIVDRSEMKALEGIARQADKLTALGTMAAGMAHEIKNPLSSMKVLTQLLPQKFEEPEFRRKFAEIMPREIGRIDRIVESLLGFARATSPKFEPVNISEIIDETLDYFDEKIKDSGIKVSKEYAALPKIQADIQQLSQVFSNLVLNAVQAMPDGGELKIAASPKRKVGELVEEISIEVTDTGYGITPENQKKLFDPFFTTKHGGTGLGLTIAHSVIDGHKGTIEVKSKIGKGTSFSIALPVNQ
ncbi:MAG: ATP-binding protein, partial [Candidatus Saganbacteria bacterium]|nr:ATP-binding protein [Candidatus Saganbacteria bacterium]